MSRTALLLVCLLVLVGCGQKGPLIAPEPARPAQPSSVDDDVADDEDPDQDEDAEDRRRRGR